MTDKISTVAMSLTEKQKLFMNITLKRWNVLSGATGAGKTYIANLKVLKQIGEDIRNNSSGNYLFVGRTLTTIERNVLIDLNKVTRRFKYNKSSKVAYFGKTKIYLEGANDRQAGEKIRGLNLKGVYLDEVATYPKDFMDMLKSRLRIPNAWAITTCNPANSKHWFNVEYRLNDSLEKTVWDFVIDDNNFLNDEIVNNLKKEYTGVLYQRYILGQWINAEGSIYKINDYNLIENNSIKIEEIDFVVTGVDIGGNKSKTTFVTVAILKNFKNVVVLDSFKINGEQNTNNIEQNFLRIVKENKELYKSKFKYIYVDSEAQVFINTFKNLILKNNLNVAIGNSVKNKITDRIYKTQQILGNGKLLIYKSCKNLLEALENALWDDKSPIDKRLDDFTSDIDTLDAFEYSWERWIKFI